MLLSCGLISYGDEIVYCHYLKGWEVSFKLQEINFHLIKLFFLATLVKWCIPECSRGLFWVSN